MGFPEDRPQITAQAQFLRHQKELEALPLDQRFQYIFENNLWGNEESRSGDGSTLQETRVLREAIVALLAEVGATSLLDAPCGDFNWLSEIRLNIPYTGADIVPALIEANNRRYASPTRTFLHRDLTGTSPSDPLPPADVVLCRDCLVHLSYANIAKAFASIRKTGARYLLTTHFTGITANHDIADGDWRALNFELAPFHLPPPVKIINENCAEAGGAFSDKSLGLWRVADLPETLDYV